MLQQATSIISCTIGSVSVAQLLRTMASVTEFQSGGTANLLMHAGAKKQR